MFEIVTLCEANTPAVNAAVVPPADSVPVDVMVAVPVNPVTVLLRSEERRVGMQYGVPAICVPMAPPPAFSTRKLFSTPGFTVTALLVVLCLFFGGGVFLPVFEIVTLCEVSTPAVNATVVPPADSVPVDVMVAVPVNPVTVLLFASRAVILMLNADPAVCVGMTPPPIFSTRKLFSTPGFTVIRGLVFAVFVPSVISVAVRVLVPAVFSVTLNVCVPEASAAFAGRVALVSVEVIPTVCVELMTFQFASTAFTVTVNATPAVRAVGVPVFPLTVPGAAVSPGTSSCSFVNTWAGLIGTPALAQPVFLTIVQLIVTEAAPTSVEPPPVCDVLMFHRSVCPASAVTAPSSLSAFAPMVSWTTSSAAEATVTDGKLELPVFVAAVPTGVV